MKLHHLTTGHKNQVTLQRILLVCLILTISHCQSGKIEQEASPTLKVEVINPVAFPRSNTLVKVSRNQLAQVLAEVDLNKLVVFDGDKEMVSQTIGDNLVFSLDKIGAGAKKMFVLEMRKSSVPVKYQKKCQAELAVKTGGVFENHKYIGGEFENISYLRVPEEHTDHSFYIRYEGPGWESDLVGYRFYLDWRNAIDVFGKKSRGIILQNVGLDGFDSYHEMQPWGMDVLRVGSSLGLGSLGIYLDRKAVRVEKTDSVVCRVRDNGPIYAAIQTNYYGWKVGDLSMDLESVLSIHADTRLTHHEILVSGDPDNLCTGIGKDENAGLFTFQGSRDQWGYIATYGVQSLNDDRLGLAVFFSNKHFKGFTEDENSHIVKLKPVSSQLDYYFMAAWEGEEDGIKDEVQFLKYVKQISIELATPLNVSLAG